MCIPRGDKQSPNPPRLICPLRGIKPLPPTPLLNSHQPPLHLLFNMASRPDMRVVRAVTSKKKVDIEQAATLQRTGQNAYKDGDLQGAIESFTQVRPILFVPSRLILIMCISRHWWQTMRILEFLIIVQLHIAS